jgi:predicted metal-dependent phosphoesterase TrpH
MYKIDLHTHSSASPDGALLARHYRDVLGMGMLDYIAVTDHNTIEFAKKLHHELGDSIIVGEEITTKQGEIIGLYLQELIPEGLSIEAAIKAIHKQHGLVYIPHPFETVRKGVKITILDSIAHEVDIIEVHNGRAFFQNRGGRARAWAAQHNIAGASGSDAHGRRGWSKTYSLISDPPTATNLVEQLKDAEYIIGSVGMLGVLYPKFNRIRKRARRV